MTKSQVDGPYLPFAVPSIEEDEIAAVVETLRSGWLTTGPKTHEFERKFAEAIGSRYALAVNSATAGLHLALEAVGVGKDDWVITTPWTFTATAEVIRYLGAHPAFVDVDPNTLNIDVRAIENTLSLYKATGRRITAILPVHFSGQACMMSDIMNIAFVNGLKVVEDAAHAFPTNVTSRSVTSQETIQRNVGTVGHATVFSFYATKTITTGEGGMVTTDDEALADRVRLMRLHGINRDIWDRYSSTKPKWYYEVVAPGFKYNMTDVAAAIGIQQLAKSGSFHRRRSEIAVAYNEAFADVSEIEVPQPASSGTVNSWHLYVLRLNLDRLRIDRNRFIEEMGMRNVGCSVHFIPLHLHPYWRDTYGLAPDAFPTATREHSRVVSLPIYPGMTNQMVERVTMAVLDVLKTFRR